MEKNICQMMYDMLHSNNRLGACRSVAISFEFENGSNLVVPDSQSHTRHQPKKTSNLFSSLLCCFCFGTEKGRGWAFWQQAVIFLSPIAFQHASVSIVEYWKKEFSYERTTMQGTHRRLHKIGRSNAHFQWKNSC
jgi:hypothetical protein